MERGYTQFYRKVGVDIEQELEAMAVIREEIGPRRFIQLDGNEAWTVAEAVRNLTALDRWDVGFAEQPVPSQPIENMIDLRSKTRVPLAFNEGLWRVDRVTEVIRRRAADYLVFGPYWVGTLANFQRLGHQAAIEGLVVNKHTHGELGIFAAANQHVLLNLPRINEGNQQTAQMMQDDVLVSPIPIATSPWWGSRRDRAWASKSTKARSPPITRTTNGSASTCPTSWIAWPPRTRHGMGAEMVREPLRGTLGVRPVLNAAATLTAIGGSVMPREVLDAMVEASVSHVDMHELHVAAGRELAALTRNEGAYVTCGAAAAVAHGLLACVTHGDPALIADMPGGDGLPTEVVVHCAHRIPYDRFIDLVGCRTVQIGNAIQTFEWELERALSPRTAAVLWVAGSHLSDAALRLERTMEMAHAHGVPVIIDAAAQLPPSSNLWHFTHELGADLVAFSGGKALRGPQASGLLLGRADLIDAARANGSPHQRLLPP